MRSTTLIVTACIVLPPELSNAVAVTENSPADSYVCVAVTVLPVKSVPSKVLELPSPKSMTKWLIVPSESDGTVNMNVCASPAVPSFALIESTVGSVLAIVVSNVIVPDCPLESVTVFVVDQVPELVYSLPFSSQPPSESVSQTTPADPQSPVESVSVEVSNTRATTVPM